MMEAVSTLETSVNFYQNTPDGATTQKTSHLRTFLEAEFGKLTRKALAEKCEKWTERVFEPRTSVDGRGHVKILGQTISTQLRLGLTLVTDGALALWGVCKAVAMTLQEWSYGGGFIVSTRLHNLWTADRIRPTNLMAKKYAL
jgi:hypothetical protein